MAGTESSQAPTCVIADDHPAIVASVSRLLERTGFEVVGHAADGLEALALIRALDPDLVFVDLEMPGLGGIEIARHLNEERALPRVIIYAGEPDVTRARQAFDAGAAGFVLKGSSLPELVRAVKTVSAGGTFVDAAIASRLAGSRTGRRADLTTRERDVVSLLAEGMSTDEIAAGLSISALTVRTHVKHVMEKLKASSRTEAVATALRRSLIG